MTDSPDVPSWVTARRAIREKSAQLVARIPHTDHNGRDTDAPVVVAFPQQNPEPEPPAAA